MFSSLLSVSAGAAVGIAVGCVAFLAMLTAMAYKCYRRRVMRNAQNRLSSAIKKGLQESGSGSFKKSVPVRGTGSGSKVMKSKGTSPITPPGGESSAERMPMTGFSQSSGGGSGLEPVHVKAADMYLENEKDGATPEKEEILRAEQYSLEEGCETPIRHPLPTKLGTLSFSVCHDEAKSALMVSIVCANDLPPRDPTVGGCDPYVKLQLLPEKKHKCKTRVVRKTLNPEYDETFTFYGINANLMSGITLHFVVLSFDRFSRDEIIGEVIYPLSETDLEKKEAIVTRDITPRHLKVLFSSFSFSVQDLFSSNDCCLFVF